ncbi:ATP-dependent DNA helicase DDM1-like [Benincasa hispida]|uniref:ATP-dependent DNA helicase DDM1-like n=1 Tax=Benincasa hispida TaxID=102211 RepID=UPI001901F1E2|nr:ATP-dependent DNA helicase DDM1-like [Benincasa hispida]
MKDLNLFLRLSPAVMKDLNLFLSSCLSGKCQAKEKEETQENRKAQMVAKLHGILRPFLLQRMKSNVELMLPRKKEIIIGYD